MAAHHPLIHDFDQIVGFQSADVPPNRFIVILFRFKMLSP